MWPKASFDQISKFHFPKLWETIASCESTGRELSFEWSHHRISSTDSKARVTLQNSIKHPGSERVNDIAVKPIINQRQKYTLPQRAPLTFCQHRKGRIKPCFPQSPNTMLCHCQGYLQKTANTPTLNGWEGEGCGLLCSLKLPHLRTISQQ